MRNWTNREHNWPLILKDRVKRKFGPDAAIVNPAMGGTELRQNGIVMPRGLDHARAGQGSFKPRRAGHHGANRPRE